MSTVTAAPHAPRADTRTTFARAISAEIAKLLTLRSTFVIAVVMIGVSAGFSALIAISTVNFAEDSPADTASFATATVLGSTVAFAQLVIGVFAVLAVTGEYATRTIQTTFVAVPRRLRVLGAKTVVVLGATLLLSVLSSVMSYALAAPILSGGGLLAPLTDPRVFGAMAGSAVYLLIVALLSVMVGTLTRHSAASIAAVVGVFFVLPLVLSLVSPDDSGISTYALDYTAQMVSRSFWDAELVQGLWRNIALTLGWLGVVTAPAMILLRKRDV